MKIKPCIYITPLFVLAVQCFAQQPVLYNMNNYRGLPSNHVYCTFTDNLGYLWIGTNEGVVQYNGYVARTYDMSQGISDADVWHFYQDSKNRIWLSRISDELGYIYNGHYYSAKPSPKKDIVFYPKYLREKEGSIILTTVFDNKFYLCNEKEGIVKINELSKYYNGSDYFITPGGDVYYFHKDTLYRVSDDLEDYVYDKQCIADKYSEYQLLGSQLIPAMGNTVKNIVVTDIRTCTQRTIPTNGPEVVYNHYENNNRHHIITNKSIYTFGSEPDKYVSRPLNSYLPKEMLANNQIAYISHDDLWRETISTTNEGLFLRFDTTSFISVSTALTKFNYLGRDTRENLYWWNKENKVIARIDKNEDIIIRHYPEIRHIEHVTEYSNDNMLVFSPDNLLLLNTQDMTTVPLFGKMKYYIYDNDLEKGLSYKTKIDDHFVPKFGGQCGVYGKDSVIRCIVRGNGYMSYTTTGDTLKKKALQPGRYNGIVRIPKYNSYIIYENQNIVIDTKDTMFHITEPILNMCGIRQIEQIICDSNSGMVYIKDYDKLFCYSLRTGKFTRILKRYKLAGAKIDIIDGKLAVAGRFGVLVAGIGDNPKTTIQALYPNTKRLVYNNVYDIASSGNNILINTENGLFKVKMPADGTSPYKETNHPGENVYKVILSYNDQLRNIRAGDTIRINDKTKSLQFDVVNPMGTGKLQFATFFKEHDAGWNEMNSNELYLPWINSDRYYSMSLKAKDDIWESDNLQLVVYLIPTFWQTKIGMVVLWSSICLASLLVILLVIYYTRLIVSKIHEERNKLLSFKLKSVYAQINPHFIFNTLNTGLYFIKENKNAEAFTHISSFSQLLRSYIKSSRNKYVTLAEEAENLEHYIRLQQYRFANKFDYEMTIGAGIDATATLLPSMLLQPFTENAINHGLIHKKEKGLLTIKFLANSQENEITCIIDDDGIGREISAQINKNNPNKTDSYGSELIADLVKLINDDKVIKVDIQYIDKAEPNTGTTVIITIKKLHNDKRLLLYHH